VKPIESAKGNQEKSKRNLMEIQGISKGISRYRK